MMNNDAVKNDVNVSAAFSRQSPIFDGIYNGNQTTLWMRDRVRREVLSNIATGGRILELNCGTGIDSAFFAQAGYNVLATDNADGMLEQLNSKIAGTELTHKLTTKKCSFNNIGELNEGTFDYVFSNFGGLNCTDKLYQVIEGIDKVLKPGGFFTLVVMPTVCPWEIVMLFKGYFKTAFRRFKKNGTSANIEGVKFNCYYYNPAYIIGHAGKDYKLKTLKGLCITVPPPFIENFHEKHSSLFNMLEKIENKLWSSQPFNRWCDHYIISMQKMK